MKKRLDTGRQLLELRFKTLREEDNRSHPQILGHDRGGIVHGQINRNFKNRSSVLLSSL